MARGYKVVFTGRLVEGHEHEAIRERLARRFKVPETKMGHFFEGQPFVVTIRPEEDEAERCRGALEQAGLLCTVIPLRDGPARKEAYQKVPPPSHEQLLPPDPEPAAVHQELIPAREIPRRSDAPDPQEPTPVATVVREQRVVEIREPDAKGPSTRQLLGLAGAVLMLIGSFCPVVSIPIMGSISYVNNGQGDGVFVLIMAVVALVAVFVRRYRLLYWSGSLSLAVMLFAIARFSSKMAEVKSDMARELAGNPFRGLAEVAVHSVQLQWGWGLLITGAVLVLAAAVVRGSEVGRVLSGRLVP